MSEENKPSQEVLDLAGKMKEKIKVDKTTGIGEVEDGLYKDLLPEDLTMKIVTSVKDHDRNFIAAGAKAFGEMAIEAMAHNNKLSSASLSVNMTKLDNVSYNIERHREYKNHLTGDGVTVDKYGTLTTTYEVKGGKNSGDLKKVRMSLQEIAVKKLCKK